MYKWLYTSPKHQNSENYHSSKDIKAQRAKSFQDIIQHQKETNKAFLLKVFAYKLPYN